MPLIQPDTATATSQFSGLYDIGNVIDGSGLPLNFTPSDAHGDYSINNHWTTAANAINNGVTASFSFNEAVNLDKFYLWNHRSNNIANDPNYAVTQFDLIFRDGNNNVIFSLLNLSATGGIANAQTYNFNTVAGVKSVDFVIDRNQGSPYTGLAEVAFNEVIPPLPTVSIRVSPTNVSEDGSTNLIYTLARTGTLTNPLTVNYSITGTATKGVDYANILSSVTFAANSATAKVTVNPTTDSLVEAGETVVLTLNNGTGYTVADAKVATGTITNDDGGSGNDILIGGSGNDNLNGKAGNDTITGNRGNDTVTGGAGKDRYVFNAPRDRLDRITDYNVVDDTIALLGTGFGLTRGTLPAHQFTVGSSATTQSQRVIYNNSNGALFFDPDGSRSQAAVEIASLSPNLNFTHQDILVI